MKYLPICMLLIVLAQMWNTQNKKGIFSEDPKIIYRHQTNAKAKAFSVLIEKCNVCHATKKRTDIFTMDNMDSLASDIHKQVFIKKKMPKGRKIKLTEEELEALRIWLSSDIKANIK